MTNRRRKTTGKSKAGKKAAPKAQSPKSRTSKGSQLESTLELLDDVAKLKREMARMTEDLQRAQERTQDIEIHLNLLTRLLTTLCVEKFGMRVGVLKRIIREIEKEAIRDSQIHHLESLYQLPPKPNRRDKQNPPRDSDDRWEDIS